MESNVVESNVVGSNVVGSMRLSKFAALMCCLLLLGCSSDDSDKETEEELGLPYIGEIYTRIDHYHPTYWTKFGHDPIGLKMEVDFQALHPNGVSELTDIYIYSPVARMFWDILGGPEDESLDRFYDADQKEFSTHVYNQFSTERVPLRNYEVDVVDRNGNTAIKYFDFKGFNGGALAGKEYVYSAQYESPTSDGMRAMEAMTIARNSLTFTSNPGEGFFTIGFTHRDSRAINYYVRFYDSEPERNLIAIADFESASIVSTPLVAGSRTLLDLPYSEVLGEDGLPVSHETIENIDGIHIVLADEMFEKEFPEDEQAFNYYGYSEFVTLPTPSNE